MKKVQDRVPGAGGQQVDAPLDQRTDAELVAAALDAASAQDRTAVYEAIAARHQRQVLRLCASRLRDPDAAGEAGQTTFEDAFKLLNVGRGPADHAKLGGWLMNIAANRCMDPR